MRRVTKIIRLGRWKVELSGGWGLALELINWAQDGSWSLHVAPVYGQIYLRLPFLTPREPKDQMLDKWGFSWRWSRHDHMAIHFGWGERGHITYVPWSWEHHRTAWLREDGSWQEEKRGAWIDCRHEPGIWRVSHPYRYTLRSGEVQERTATISVSEREWHWRISKALGLPWPRMVHRSIDVHFSDEVGERTGSWKGGTVGCGYDMQSEETPLDCLRRMEKERKFR